jgi:hypothetical protein
MANTVTYYNAVQTHFFAQDTSIVAGFTTPVFLRNFRILDVEVFVTTAAAASTLTLTRVRGGVSTTICVLDTSGTGRAVITTDISQTAALFENGDTLVYTANAAGATVVSNIIVYLQQFSI